MFNSSILLSSEWLKFAFRSYEVGYTGSNYWLTRWELLLSGVLGSFQPWELRCNAKLVFWKHSGLAAAQAGPRGGASLTKARFYKSGALSLQLWTGAGPGTAPSSPCLEEQTPSASEGDAWGDAVTAGGAGWASPAPRQVAHLQGAQLLLFTTPKQISLLARTFYLTF